MINATQFPKPAKVSTLDVDGDLDMGAHNLKVDDIIESTGAAGVAIVGLKADTIVEKTGAAGVGVVGLKADIIAEKTATVGVTIDTLLLKDNQVRGRKIAASNDVLDSEDAIVHITTGYGAYIEYHTVTIPNYIRYGIARLSASIKPEYSAQTAYVKWLVNGIITGGGEQSFVYVDAATYSTKTEDVIVHGGDVIGYWMKCVNNYFHYKEIRILGVVSQMPAGAWNLT